MQEKLEKKILVTRFSLDILFVFLKIWYRIHQAGKSFEKGIKDVLLK